MSPALAAARLALAFLRREKTARWETHAGGQRLAIAFAGRRLRVKAPRLVLDVAVEAGGRGRVLAFSRGDWEARLAQLAGAAATPAAPGGTSWKRRPGPADPLLARMLAARGLKTVPLARKRLPEARRAVELAAARDGAVAKARSHGTAAEHTREVKRFALGAGAALVGVARMRPEFATLGTALEHDWLVAIAVAEDYADVLGGPAAVERGAHRAYGRGAEIATDTAQMIRQSLGHAARAHHTGAGEIQALPAAHQAGLGELGRHGSLIHPALGASWRAAFVTTTLPLEPDAPLAFGVQDYCLNCRLCEQACPGEAIAPAADYMLSAGVRRWLVDTEKCYPFSRLREEYCHLCVDVCPYIHKENGDAQRKQIYKLFVRQSR